MVVEDVREEIATLNGEMDRLRDFLGYFDSLIEEQSNIICEEYDGREEKVVNELVGNIRKINHKKSSYDAESLEAISHIEKSDEDNRYNIVTEKEEVKDEKEINEIISRLEFIYDKRNILYESVLTNLISQVEAYFSDILRLQYSSGKREVDKNEKKFSLKDIKELGSIDEAKERVISEKIDGVLSGPFDSWIEGVKNEIGIGMGYLGVRMDECKEAYQRRNIIIHNDGVIDRGYIDKTSEKYRHEGGVGEEIYITKEYLSRKIDIFHSVCVLTGLDIWKTNNIKDDKRAKFTDRMISIYSERGNEYLAGSLGKFQMMNKNMPEPYVRMGKFNYWHLKKEMGEWSDIKDEVDSESVLGMDPRIKSCYYALTEDIDRLCEALKSALATEDVIPDDVKVYPIFKHVRDNKKISNLVSSYS